MTQAVPCAAGAVALLGAAALLAGPGSAAPAPGPLTCWNQPQPTWTAQPTPTPTSTSGGTPVPYSGGTGTPFSPGSNPETGGGLPTKPTGPRAAGIDWHDWWGGERLYWWPAHDRDATATLGARGEQQLVGPWVQQCERLCDQGAWNDRAAMGEALAFLKSPLLLGLALRLMNDPNEQVARQGVYATAAAMPTPAAGLLQLRGVAEDPRANPHRRAAAATAMGALGDPAARDFLLRLAQQRAERTVAIGALVGLALLPDAESVPLLRRVLLDGREKTVVQTGAAAALGVLARVTAAAGPATDALLEAARRADKLNVEVRQTVALNLGHAEPTALVLRSLAALCADDGDQRTRCMAAIALGRLARRTPDVSERARLALVARWDEEPADVRAFLALGLGIGRLGAERSRLEHWLHGRGDPLHRAAAAVALGCLGEAPAHRCIAKATTDGSPQFRGDAAEALGLLGTAECAATLRALCDDAKAGAPVRAGAAYGLGLIGEPADRERLERALVDGNGDARTGAVLGLGAYAGGPARDALLARAAGESMPSLRGLMVWAALLAVAERPLAGPGKAVQRSPWAREH